MPLPPPNMRSASNQMARSTAATSDAPAPKQFVLAKLIELQSFRRATLKFLDNGVIVKNITIASATKDNKSNAVEPGTIFYITDYPTDNKGNLAPDDFDGKPNYLNRRSARMNAHELTGEEDEADGMESVPPTELMSIIKDLVQAFTKPLKNMKNGVPTLVKAPKNLEDALKRLKKPSTTKTRSIHNHAQANTSTTGRAKQKVISGAYIEQTENGITFSSNNKGVIIDDKGNVSVQGAFKNNQFGTERPAMGMDSFANPIADMQPKTVVTPMFMGPLALDRLPNFNIINWAFKLFQTFNTVNGIIFAETGKQLKLKGKSKKITDSETSQGEAESSDKKSKSGVMKILDKIPFP